jgi:hypothetical protein
VGLSAEDRPALSPRMPVLHALNRTVGDFPDTFFAIGEREKRCSFTATLIRRSACHLFRHDVVFGLTEKDKYLLTSLPTRCSVFCNVTQLYFIRHVQRTQSFGADKLVIAFLEIC